MLLCLRAVSQLSSSSRLSLSLRPQKRLIPPVVSFMSAYHRMNVLHPSPDRDYIPISDHALCVRAYGPSEALLLSIPAESGT